MKSDKSYRRVSKLYGLTREEYDQMVEDQGGKCAICGSFGNSRKSLAVDHDHRTGKVRGLLCEHCNNGLGCFLDDVRLLIKAIKYLRG